MTVPPDCTAILAFTGDGVYRDGIASDVKSRAYISADLNATVATIENAQVIGLLAIANQICPKVPVSAGERILVAFSDTFSAVIYFESAEI